MFGRWIWTMFRIDGCDLVPDIHLNKWYRSPRLIAVVMGVGAIGMVFGYGVNGVWRGSLDNILSAGFAVVAVACLAFVMVPWNRLLAEAAGALFVVCTTGRAFTTIVDAWQFGTWRAIRITMAFATAPYLVLAYLSFIIWNCIVIPYSRLVHTKRTNG